jgi:hypothetical protein
MNKKPDRCRPPPAVGGTAGSGKTYAAKGFVERLLDIGARVAIVDRRDENPTSLSVGRGR